MLHIVENRMELNWKTIVAWGITLLGIGHIGMGLVRFWLPFSAALQDGFIGAFSANDTRRLAMWFTLFGPAITVCGHLAIRAAAASDLDTLKIIGFYLLATALLGVAAFPRSPIWALLILSCALLAIGYGRLV
jgi:hypothetical protein